MKIHVYQPFYISIKEAKVNKTQPINLKIQKNVA